MKELNSTSVFNNRGFTLIEILIAITLLAFITIGVVSITQNAADTKDRTTEINKNNLQIETALSRFEWDFTQIYSPLYFSQVLDINRLADPFGANANFVDANGDGLDDNTGRPLNQTAAQISPELQEYYQRLQQRFERNEHFSAVSQEGLPIPRFYSPEPSTFEFFTSSNRRKIENVKQSHFAWVRYSLGEPILRADEEKNPAIPPSLKTLVRYFSADDPYGEKRLDPQDAAHVKGAVLLENVERLEFQFWDMQGRKWESNLRTIVGGENMLRGVRLSVTWYDSSGHKRTVQRIYRNHWPLEVPQDQLTNPQPRTATTTPGTTREAED
jgi:prepilin-type N-terminal cleavage/methylation domain-containing protein